MRILLLTHRLPYAPNRGDRLRAWHLLRHLAGEHEITLVSLVHDREEASHVGELASLAHETITAHVPYLGNRVRAGFALATDRPLTHVLLDSPALLPVLQRIVEERPPDVVLAYCSSMARFAVDRPLDSIPLVIDMVDADSAKWADLARIARRPLRWIYRREARLLGRFEAAAMRRARVTLVVNDREREALAASAPGANVVVLPNGVDLARFAPPKGTADALHGSSPGIVFCGVMNYPPNEAGAVWLAREVWPLVRQSEPAATLWLVGAQPTRTVKTLCATGLGIEVTGAVDDVRPYLWNAAVSAAPLHTARGVQNKVLEAIAAGLPAVVTQVVWDGLPRQAHPACRVAQTPGEFADAILTLVRMTPTERRALANSAGLPSLGWETTLAPLKALLQEAGRCNIPPRC